jgi:arginine N-succinyltransferase
MIIVRPVTPQDIDSLERCALTVGIGMTHLPRRRDLLEKKISDSLKAFSKELKKPENEDYLFVIEDIHEKTVGGTCGIYSKVGATSPFYVYQVEDLPPPSHRFPVPKEKRLLRLISYESGPTEVCALYLLPEFRKGGIGRLLSLSRFLFMAAFPYRFEKTTMANMRGVIEKNVSPFWDGLSRHFLDVDFEEVMSMRCISEGFLRDILPKHPIYVALLHETAQEVIGKTHANTGPAFNMLFQEGFRFIKEIDPIDGGPIIATETAEIRTVKDSVLVTIKEISLKPIESERFIVGNNCIDFRACYATLQFVQSDQVIISEDVGQALNVQRGDTIRYIKAK